ncbi:histidinol dehydrogenase, partial [Campylobacter fetus]|uniref:histidinol dehydrogenase n=1 Tax=Campylobacter fetus TaxID=196 RepID=UPI0021D5766C
CTFSHYKAGIVAVENALGITPPLNALLTRTLMNAALFLHDHIVHFYQLHGLDWADVVSALSADVKKASDEVQSQLELLPRKELASKSIANSRIIIAKDLNQALEISNLYAPEHLIIQTQNPRELLKGVKHAGSVFLGAYSPESMGDYASGTNHVLPTYGLTKMHSSLSLMDF